MKFILLILLFILVASAQRTPTISHISSPIVTDIGGTIELVCSVQYINNLPVLWMKLDSKIGKNVLPISTGTALILRDNRFSLRYDTASTTYTLQIKDIQETDAGIYQCQIIVSINNKIISAVPVQVRKPPVISDNSTRGAVVNEGQSVTLECYADGFPIPRMSWRRENNALLPTGGSVYRGNSLKINNIRKEDRGTYYCVADNDVGKGARRNVAVEVEFSPVLSIPRPRVGQALNYDMDLECHVEAFPAPSISWFKDGIHLTNNLNLRISTFGTANEFTNTKLRVRTIREDLYGNFMCRAANKLGVAEGIVQLTESSIPVCPPCGQMYGGAEQVPESMVHFIFCAFLVFMH